MLRCDNLALFYSLNMARAKKLAHLSTVLTKEKSIHIVQFIPDQYQLRRALLEGDARNTHHRDAEDTEVISPRLVGLNLSEPSHPKVEHSHLLSSQVGYNPLGDGM